MYDAELKARNIVKGLSDEELFAQWNLTSYFAMDTVPQLSYIRGWLMDEIEERFPKGFNAWLEQDCPRDEDLKHFVKAEMRERRNREHKLA